MLQSGGGFGNIQGKDAILDGVLRSGVWQQLANLSTHEQPGQPPGSASDLAAQRQFITSVRLLRYLMTVARRKSAGDVLVHTENAALVVGHIFPEEASTDAQYRL